MTSGDQGETIAHVHIACAFRRICQMNDRPCNCPGHFQEMSCFVKIFVSGLLEPYCLSEWSVFSSGTQSQAITVYSLSTVEACSLYMSHLLASVDYFEAVPGYHPAWHSINAMQVQLARHKYSCVHTVGVAQLMELQCAILISLSTGWHRPDA